MHPTTPASDLLQPIFLEASVGAYLLSALLTLPTSAFLLSRQFSLFMAAFYRECQLTTSLSDALNR
jgi:hypothetical protein